MPLGTERARVGFEVDNSKVDPGLRKTRSKFDRFSKGLTKSMAGVRGGLGMLGSGLGLVGFAGAAGMVVAAKSVGKFEDRLNRLQIQSGKSSKEMDGVRASINQLSKDTGVDRDDILAGAEGYVTLTGDMDGATKAMGTFTKVAVASGAEMSDIAATAAALKQNMKVDPADFEQAFSIMLSQGKAGAIELKELSSLLAGIAPTFSRFGTTGAAGMAQLGAMLQLTRQGFGSAAESVTGLEAMMTSFQKNARRFQANGVKIFVKDPKTGKKTMRDLSLIVKDLGNSKLMKDPTALSAAFGRVEGQKAFEELIKVPGALDDMIAKTSTANDVAQDFQTRMASDAQQAEIAFARMKVAIAEAFTPEVIHGFVDALKSAVSLVEKLVGGVTAVEDILSLGRNDKDVENMNADFESGMDFNDVMARDRARRDLATMEGESQGRDLIQGAASGLGRQIAQTKGNQANAAGAAAFTAAQMQIAVAISVDEQGLLKAEQKKKRTERRAVK